MKICGKCKQEKPLSDFYKNKFKKDGLSDYCITCTKEENRKKYKSRKIVHPTLSNCPNCGSSKILYRSRTKDNKCGDCKIIIPVIKAGVLF